MKIYAGLAKPHHLTYSCGKNFAWAPKTSPGLGQSPYICHYIHHSALFLFKGSVKIHRNFFTLQPYSPTCVFLINVDHFRVGSMFSLLTCDNFSHLLPEAYPPLWWSRWSWSWWSWWSWSNHITLFWEVSLLRNIDLPWRSLCRTVPPPYNGLELWKAAHSTVLDL